jgi:hypothetical protein
LCGGRALALPGRILRVEADEHGTNAIAVNFAGLRPSTAKKLRSVIAIHSEGPAMMESEAAAALPLPPEITQHHHAGQRQAVQTLPEESIATASGTHSQQRQLPRHNLERRVIAVGQQALRVLMGRDLSTAGMRVAPARGLGVGDLLKIALYVQPSRKPLVLNAEIARDDGDAGLGLRFLDLGPEQLELITRMLDKLPGISEPDESAETTGVFVSELLARESG